MQRRTRIVATLGPATDPPGVLEGLVTAGLDVEEPFAEQRAAHLAAAVEADPSLWGPINAAATRILAVQLRFAARRTPAVRARCRNGSMVAAGSDSPTGGSR